jgi:sigma-B regulation protein RsbU (phosphoserine phosphatase)
VLDDLRRGDIHRTFNRDLQDLYCFYLDDAQRARLARQPRWRRGLSLIGWLLRCLVLRLAPVRRLLLLVSFLAVVYGLLRSADEQGGAAMVYYVLGYAGVLLTLMLELKDKLLARDELEVGRKVQLALLPDGNPEIDGWDVALFTRPANDVGGDLVDDLWVTPTRLGLLLGDVSGKGLGAALLMAKLQATLRALATEGDTLAELGRRANLILCRDGVVGRFATLVYLELEAGTGTVRLMNAGHLPPLVVRGGGERPDPPAGTAGATDSGTAGEAVGEARLEAIAAPSPPLGVTPDARFVEQEVTLAPGELLCIVSDGVTEARNAAGDFFGDQRLRELVGAAAGERAEVLCARLVAAVDAFSGDARSSDDLSLVVLRRLA